jgi:hypothetical protein
MSDDDDTLPDATAVTGITVPDTLDAVAGSAEVLALLKPVAPFSFPVHSVCYDEQDGDGTLLYSVSESDWFSLDVKDGTVYPHGNLHDKTHLAPAVREALRARLAHLVCPRAKAGRNPQTLHDAAYADVPLVVRAAFDAALDRRVVLHRTYEKSSQTRYAAVSEQSGLAGYSQDVFQVEVSVPGSSRKVRLGRVRDTRLGALLWCAHTVDARINDVDAARAWLREMGDETAARAWLATVADGIAHIPKPGGGGRKRMRGA